ncbi:MAG: hypothetical protein WD042_03410 [Phycisphaeraceae bacterium]
MTPSPNGPNGGARDPATGRFQPGWKGGPGNPYAKKVAALRSALIGALAPKDMAAIVKALIAKAKEGDVPAIRELLDRTLGKPQEADLIERIEQLENDLKERIEHEQA